jgi:hypothetical protein
MMDIIQEDENSTRAVGEWWIILVSNSHYTQVENYTFSTTNQEKTIFEN